MPTTGEWLFLSTVGEGRIQSLELGGEAGSLGRVVEPGQLGL
jgi:hypothetical protein